MKIKLTDPLHNLQQSGLYKRAKEIGECTRKHRLGTKHSKKTINRMKKSAKLRDDSNRIAVLQSQEHRNKISALKKGIKWSESQKEKMKKVMRTKGYRENMSAATRGIKKTEEWKTKVSFKRFGRQITFVSDSGEKETITSLRSFSKKYDLNRYELSNVINGRRESFKGWKLSNE